MGKDRESGKESKISSDYKSGLKWAISAVTCTLLMFAGFAYIAFGNNVCGNIMNNLDQTHVFTEIVIISMCINLFFMYPLFLFPLTEALENIMFDLENANDRSIEGKRNLLRVCLVLTTAGVAIV